MTHSILFATVFSSLIALPSLAFAQEKSAALPVSRAEEMTMPIVKPLSAVDILEKVDGKPMRSSTVEVAFAPGVASMPHRHPGAVFGYVLEGALEFKVEGKEMQTLKAGETFYEPTMILHEISRNPSDKNQTRILAVIVHPRDAKQLVIPAEPTETKESDDDE